MYRQLLVLDNTIFLILIFYILDLFDKYFVNYVIVLFQIVNHYLILHFPKLILLIFYL
nr:MAG TPA: hypothetical protein [Bacteriophage sp.]